MKCIQCKTVIPNTASWDILPNDMLGCVTEYLFWIEIIRTVRHISRHWYQASQRLTIWKHGITLCLCSMTCSDYQRLPFDWEQNDPNHYQVDINEPWSPLYTNTFALLTLHHIRVSEIHLDMERLVACDPALIAEALPNVHTVVLYNTRHCILMHAYLIMSAFPKIKCIRAMELRDIQSSSEYWPPTTIPFHTFSFAWIYRPHLEIFSLSLCMQVQLQELYIKDMSDSLEDTANGLCLFKLQALRRLEISCGPSNSPLDVSWFNTTNQFNGLKEMTFQWNIQQLHLNNLKLKYETNTINLWNCMCDSLTRLYLKDVIIQDVIPMMSLHVLKEWICLNSLQSDQWIKIFSFTNQSSIWPCLNILQICLDTALMILPLIDCAGLMSVLQRLRVDTRYQPCVRNTQRSMIPRRTRPEWQNRSALRRCRINANHNFLHNIIAPIKTRLVQVWPQIQIECTQSNEYDHEIDIH